MLTRIILVLLALVAVITFADWYSSPVAPCEVSAHKLVEAQKSDQPTENYCSTGKIVALWRSLGQWIDTWHDDLLAIATIVIAVFTVVLVAVSNRQAEFTRKSIDLARGEFLSSHRPRMRLKHIWLTSDSDWSLGKPIEVNLDIVNVGNTAGRITFVNYDTVLLPWGYRLPQRPPYDETPFGPGIQYSRFPTGIELPPGLTFPRVVCDGRTLSDIEIRAIKWGESKLYFIGTIEYWDASGLRQTGFCRKLTFNAYPPSDDDWGRLEIHDDYDYEFEEWS